jgi:hypothetical protein
MLCQEMEHNNSEDQVGFRNGARYVMRFASTQPLTEDSYQQAHLLQLLLHYFILMDIRKIHLRSGCCLPCHWRFWWYWNKVSWYLTSK